MVAKLVLRTEEELALLSEATRTLAAKKRKLAGERRKLADLHELKGDDETAEQLDAEAFSFEDEAKKLTALHERIRKLNI